MEETIKTLMANGKGILAADESLPSIKKRFEKIGVESTDQNRRAYRNMLFSTNGVEEFISGVILFDETLRQSSMDEILFPEFLAKKPLIPGIKVDLGTKSLGFFENEKITEGLDGLDKRFAEYFELGARFSKWRAVILIGPNMPSDYALKVNMFTLARYAVLSQEAGIVPIVEPEVLMDGSHSSEVCEEITTKVHQMLFEVLRSAKVKLENLILKTNMIVPGKKSEGKMDSQTVAQMTTRCLKNGVPTNVGGIVFLSGGMSELDATKNLNEINKIEGLPWRLTFSYGRALQDTALTTWAGRSENVEAAQKQFLKRAKLNSLASMGQYLESMEQEETSWAS